MTDLKSIAFTKADTGRPIQATQRALKAAAMKNIIDKHPTGATTNKGFAVPILVDSVSGKTVYAIYSVVITTEAEGKEKDKTPVTKTGAVKTEDFSAMFE